MGLSPKHAIKQVDRLLGNTGVNVWDWFTHWVLFVVAAREERVVALDWTEFDKDDHATIAIYLVTSHGRATLLVWKTVQKSELKNRRNDYEASLIHSAQRRDRLLLLAAVAHALVTLLGAAGEVSPLRDEEGSPHAPGGGWSRRPVTAAITRASATSRANSPGNNA